MLPVREAREPSRHTRVAVGDGWVLRATRYRDTSAYLAVTAVSDELAEAVLAAAVVDAAEMHDSLASSAVELEDFQQLMQRTYGARDAARGVPATVAWLAEEIGELARAVRKGTRDEQLHELGDTLAWLASLANQLGLSLRDAATRYERGCPRCGQRPCACP